MKKIIIFGSVLSMVLLVLLSFNSVVGAPVKIDNILCKFKSDIENVFNKNNEPNWYPGELILKFFLALYVVLLILFDIIDPDDEETI